MLEFNPERAGRCAVIVLSALIAAGCTYTAPSVGTGGAGGEGSGGSTASSSSTTSSSTTSSSTTSSSTTSSSTTSSSSSSSSGTSLENCTNDIDDDKNGTVDCADSACSGIFQCTPSVAPGQGWSTPFYSALVPYDANEPPCETGNAPHVYGMGQMPNICDPCQCGVTGALCADEAITCYGDISCNPNAMLKTTFVGPACYTVAGYASCQVTQLPTFDKGTAQCKVISGGMLTYPNPFAQKVLRCDTPTNAGGGCMPGQVCSELPAAGYDRLCIAAEGNQACPAGWGSPVIIYDSALFKDNRGCTECSCDINQATCQGTSYSRHINTTCALPEAGNIPLGACVPAGNTVTVKYVEKPPVVTPQGCRSDPTGKLELGPETTICCRPAGT